MRKIPSRILLSCLTLLLFVVGSRAAPDLFRFQGRLTDSQGRPITGTPQVSFEVYDAPTNGTRLWGPTAFQNVNANDAGLFATDIGPFTSQSIFSGTQDLYLQVTIKAGTGQTNQVLSPRQRLTAVPFSFRANRSDQATTADTVPDGSITAAKIQSGAVGSNQISDRSVMSIDLATNAVSTANIADGSVRGVDLEGDTVTPDKMNTAAFTTAGWIVPQGAIFMFLGSCPAGYAEVTELRNRLAMGADTGNTDPDVPNSAGQELGSKNHTHTIGHTHGTSVQQNYSAQQDISTGQDIVYFSNPKLIAGVGAFGGGDNIWLRGLDHSHDTVSQSTNQSGSTVELPPSLTVIFCRKQ